MKRKFLSLALCLMMVLSLMVVPAGAEGEVTLLESWFENADGERIYTPADVKVTPYMWVDNSGTVPLENASIITASYAGNRLEHVSLTSVDIAVGESKISGGTIDSVAGGETYAMLWSADKITPIGVKRIELSEDSRAEITSFSVNGYDGLITNEKQTITYDTNSFVRNLSYSKEIVLHVPVTSYDNLDLTKISPIINFEGKEISPASGEEVDFSKGSVNYVVTANDNVTKTTYKVTVDSLIKVYAETVSADFPVFDYYTLKTTNTGQSTYKSNTSAGVFSKGNSVLSYINTTTDKNDTTYDKFLLPVYYTLDEISEGSAEYDPSNEVLSTNTYTISEKEVKYVLDKSIVDANKDNQDFDELTACINQSTLMPVLAPDSTEENPNYVLRFQRRFSKMINPAQSAKFFQQAKTNNSSAYTLYNIDRMMFKTKFYIPSSVAWSNGVNLGVWHAKSTMINETFKFRLTRNNNGDISIYLRSNSTDVLVSTIKNGVDKWHDFAIDIDTDDTSGTRNADYNIYINGNLAVNTNCYTEAPTTTFGSGHKSIWHLSAPDSTARGTIYFDDIEMTYTAPKPTV